MAFDLRNFFMQKHNQHPKAKEDIRRMMLVEMGVTEKCGLRVFSGYDGHGVMRDNIYKDAGVYLGCDIDLTTIRPIHARCEDVLRAIDVSRFNVFDFDAFSSAWESVWITSQRLGEVREPVGVVITDGLMGGFRKMKSTLGEVPFSSQMLDACMMDRSQPPHLTKDNARRYAHMFMTSWFNGRVSWSSDVSGGTGVHYYAFVVSPKNGA